MNFSEYLEDVLDMQPGLMSAAAISEARKSFESFSAPKKTSEQHPEMKKSAAELRDRCIRLIDGQRKAIARVADKPEFEAAMVAARAAVAEGERIVAAKRATKAEFIAHAEQNSAASRKMNEATKG